MFNIFKKLLFKKLNVSYIYIQLLLLFGCTTKLGSLFSNHKSNLCPLQWKRGVLTPGLPKKSQ